MKISNINVYHADAGWRPWTFIKISTDEGIVGWSECSDSHGSPRGIEGVNDLSFLLLKKIININKILNILYSRTKQVPDQSLRNQCRDRKHYGISRGNI